MLITLHGESIDVEVGQKVTFYQYYLTNTNELAVTTDETYVDVIDGDIVGFKNGTHSSTLHFYQIDLFGERFFFHDTKRNRLRFLKSKAKYYKEEQGLVDNDIEETSKRLERRIEQKKYINNNLEAINNLIKQVKGE